MTGNLGLRRRAGIVTLRNRGFFVGRRGGDDICLPLLLPLRGWKPSESESASEKAGRLVSELDLRASSRVGDSEITVEIPDSLEWRWAQGPDDVAYKTHPEHAESDPLGTLPVRSE